MVGSIKIRVHAHNPSLPLTEAVSYIGSPSSVFVYDVPKKIGTWQITDVAVSVYYPDNSFATVSARMSAAGVWVATIPACDLSGRIRNGFRILASGIDEDGEPVSGYVLGVGDLAVCKLFPAPAPDPGEKAYILRYFDTAPESPKKGDVAKFDDVIKFYDGTEWVPFGSEVDLSDYYTKEETDALFDDYYTKAETDQAIDRLAAYYITYTAAGAAFPTRAALLNAQTVYSGGVVRTPTRNDYAVVLADETHDGAEYRYIYAVADGETVGQWEAQYPIETNDYTALANKPTINNVEVIGDKSGGDYGLANETTPVVTEAEVPASCYPISYSYGLAYVLGPSDIDIQIRQGNIYLSDKTHAMQYLCMFNAQNGVFRSASSSLGSTLRFNGTAPVADSWPVLDVTATGGTVVRSAKFAGALNKKQNTLTFDNTPTAGSNNPVKSGGIWTAIWGALAALPTGFSSLYDWCVDQLAGKLATSGGTAADITFAAYNAHTVEVSPGPTAAGTTATLDFRDPATDYTVSLIIGQGGQVAIKHGNITEGNIPEFDSQKRLVDSGKKVTDFAAASELHYALGETITASATLADRTMNKVEPLATNTEDIELSFPAATNGKARDFLVLINNPTGNTGTITFTPPPGATIYGDGLEQTFAEGETWEVTITEVATNQFLCKALKVTGKVVPWWLYFKAEEANVVVNMTKTGSPTALTLETSTDGETWTAFDAEGGTTPITLANIGDKVYFRAGQGGNTKTGGGYWSGDYHTFTLSGRAGAHGNAMSLLDGANKDNVAFTSSGGFSHLFEGCTNLTSAPDLPATTLASDCYAAMFKSCTSLTSIPEALPATTLYEYSYKDMFSRCTSLTAGPTIMATTLARYSMWDMFEMCSLLAAVEVRLTAWSDPDTQEWMEQVSSTGTFRCPAALGTNETITRNYSHCPTNWTVVNV